MNRELKRVSIVVLGMFLALFLSASLIQVIQVDSLAADGRNTRTIYDSYNEKRGSIVVEGTIIAESVAVNDQFKYQRVYPKPEVYSNVTGYYTLNQGLTGIEAAMNSQLSGTDSSQFLSKLNAILTGQPVQGANVELTLSSRMQQAAWDGLAGFSGAVAVVEPSTGKVLALSSKPSYDPNALASHNTKSVIETYKSLLNNPGKPLIDRAITGDMNPPGSVFKLVMMAAALESGKYSPESTFPNPAKYQLPGTNVYIGNANGGACPPGGATVSLNDALRYSCNIPFAQLGLALGRDAILTQAKKFGFNTSFQIPLKVEMSNFPTTMNDSQTALASFGQFDVRATPLQMAMVSAGIANGGKVMYPNMVNAVVESNLRPSSQFEAKEFSQAMTPANAATLTKMMVAAVDDSYLITNARISGVKVAGKTGTAENGDGKPFTFWFTGFAPADNPKYAVAVVIENGGGLGFSSSTNDIAVPIARKVLEAELKKMRPTAGQIFGGRYELQSRIAIGGMGEVWQATDQIIGRSVAIKILKDEYLGDPGFLERFRAEARHAALVNHEGIANVYDYGEEEGSAYLVMELVPGEPLSAVIEREKQLSTDKVLDIIAQTSAALQAAHSAGLVHRDIKPGNMLITPEGRVKITDFGIARIADQVPLTATGQVMGTVQYLSPEQASGHPASPSTDIYSLGIVAFECLSGKRPFTGESQVAIAMAQINDEPPALPETIAEPVRNLVYCCIEKKPENRPSSAANLARGAQSLRRGDLAAAVAAVPGILGEGPAVSDATMVMPRTAATGATTVLNIPEAPAEAQVTPEKKRSPWTWPLIALIGVLALVLVGAVIALIGSGGVSPTPTQTATATPTKSSSATPTPTPSATTANIEKATYVGKTLEEATAALQKLNMNVNAIKGIAAPDAASINKVYDVNPTGPAVANGTTINLTYYATPVIATPAVPTIQGTATPIVAGTSVTATFNGTCPAGFGNPEYVYSIDGGTKTSSSVASVTFTAPAAGSHTLSYYVNCTGLTASASASAPFTTQ